MAAKIPVRVHIGVTPMPLAVGQVPSETRVTITEQTSGAVHIASILPDATPIQDEGGGCSFTVDFPLVQSGESLHVAVRCLDENEVLIGVEATHDDFLEEVQDSPPAGSFFQPTSIYFNPI
jgi:hypothetical protein